MKLNLQKQRWLLDVALFMIFITTFFLDLTGLPLHQWLGIMAGALAACHLVTHWAWVKTVTRRFFGNTSAQAQYYYVVDALVLISLAAILLTGVVMSTWLNLNLANYEAWRTAHVVASIAGFTALLVKIAAHWRWIAAMLRRPTTQLEVKPPAAPRPAVVPLQSGARSMTRREFMKVMGLAGVVSVFALQRAVQSLQSGVVDSLISVQASADPTALPTGTPTAQAVAAAAPTIQPTAAPSATSLPATATAVPVSVGSTSCTVRCPRGCSYPGHCRRYQDANGNGRCDLGECM